MTPEQSCEPSVAVLLSTYNGERYLRAQLDSLVSQDYAKFSVIVRDDGSTDRTSGILADYQSRLNLKIMEDCAGNLGPGRSFLRIVSAVESDIYMFCDQDDVWVADKISKTVCAIGTCGNDLAVLAFSDLTVVDGDGTVLHKSFLKSEGGQRGHPVSLEVLAVQNCAVGCTMAFTKPLRDRALRAGIPEEGVAMHDWWFALYAFCAGKLIFLPEALVLYRQHPGNVSGASSGALLGISRRHSLRERIRRLRRYKYRIGKQALCFANTYRSELTPEQLATLGRVSEISGKHWLRAWVRCLVRGSVFDRVRMNLAFLMFPPSPEP